MNQIDDIVRGIFGGKPAGSVTATPQRGLYGEGVTRWKDTVDAAATEYGVDSDFVLGVMNQESSGREDALSPKGAMGPMQLMPATAQALEVDDPWDPEKNIRGGAKLLGMLVTKYGDKRKALAAYNWGEPGLDRAIEKYGDQWDQHLPDETRDYIEKIQNTTPLEVDFDSMIAGIYGIPMPEQQEPAAPAHVDLAETPAPAIVEPSPVAAAPMAPATTPEITKDSLKFSTAPADPRGGTGMNRDIMEPPEMVAERYQATGQSESALESFLQQLESAATYRKDPEALTAGRFQANPVASAIGTGVGMVAPALVGGQALIKSAQSIPQVTQLVAKYGKGGKAAFDALSRMSVAGGDYTARYHEDLTSKDEAVRNKAIAGLLATVAASGASVAPEMLKSGWWQPILQGITGGATNVAAQAMTGENPLAPEAAASTIFQTVLGGVFGLPMAKGAKAPVRNLRPQEGPVPAATIKTGPEDGGPVPEQALKPQEPAKISDEDVARNRALLERLKKESEASGEADQSSFIDISANKTKNWENNAGKDYIWTEGLPIEESRYVKRGTPEELEYQSRLAAIRDEEAAISATGVDRSPFGKSRAIPRTEPGEQPAAAVERAAVPPEAGPTARAGTATPSAAEGAGVVKADGDRSLPVKGKSKKVREPRNWRKEVIEKTRDLDDDVEWENEFYKYELRREYNQKFFGNLKGRRGVTGGSVEAVPEKAMQWLRQKAESLNSSENTELRQRLGLPDNVHGDDVRMLISDASNTEKDLLRFADKRRRALNPEEEYEPAPWDLPEDNPDRIAYENGIEYKGQLETGHHEFFDPVTKGNLTDTDITLIPGKLTKMRAEFEAQKPKEARDGVQKGQKKEVTSGWKRTKDFIDDIRKREPIPLFENEMKSDSDRGYARYIDKNFNKLPEDLQEWWMKRPSYRDQETGEQISVMDDGVRGTHVYEAKAGNFEFSDETGTLPGFEDTRRPWEIEQARKEQERKANQRDNPLEGTMFDQNEMEARATQQEDMFTSGLSPEEKIRSMEKEPAATVMGGVKYDPTARGNLPKYAGNVNIDRIGSDYDAKRAINDIADEYRGSIEANRGPKATHDETAKLAEQVGLSKESLLSRKKGEVWDRAKTLAARDLHIKAVERLVQKKNELMKKRQEGTITEQDMVDFLLEEKRVAAIQAEISGLAAEAGRLLESFKILSEGKRAKETFENIRSKIEGSKSTEAILDGLSKIDDADISTISKFIRRANKATLPERINRYFIESILSALPTDEANIAGNAIFSGMRTFLERPATAITEKVVAPLQGRKPEIHLLETKHEAAGLINSIVPAWKALTRTLLTGEQKYIPKPTEDIKSPSKSKLAALLPTRRLAAEDEFFKTITFGAKIRAIAYRTAKNEGLTGKAMDDRIKEITHNPELFPEQYAEAWNEAKYRTFTDDPGEITKAINKMRRSLPLKLGYYIVPFLNTPIKILKAALDRLPITGEISLGIKASKGLKGKEVSEEIGKLIPSHLLAIPIVMLARSGLITGAGPTKKEEKNVWNKTHQPYSVKIGDSHYSYSRFEPMSSIVGMIADFSTLDMTEENQDQAQEIATRIANSIQQNIYNKTFFSQLDALVSAAQEPGKYGEKFIANFAGSAVPSIVAKAGESFDPYVREKGGVKEIIQGRIPGAMNALFPKRDIWGEPVERDKKGIASSLSPVSVRKISSDKVDAELDRLKIKVGNPSRNVLGVKLSDQQYDDFSRISGQNAYEAISKYVNSGSYDSISDETKKYRINKLFDSAREKASSELGKKYDLFDIDYKIRSSNKPAKELFNELRKSGVELNRAMFWKKYKMYHKTGGNQ